MQRNFKAEGLVLKTRPLGEADKLITLLTWEMGKFEAVARGARKTKSRLAGGVDLFTRGRYIFHQGRTWPIITGQETLEHFIRFREDPDLYPYGLFLVELADRLIVGEEPCAAICDLLLEGWRQLGDSKNRLLLCKAFELKLAHHAGYSPCLHQCSICGVKDFIPGKDLAFSPGEGGLLCSHCLKGETIKLDFGTAALAQRLLKAPLDQVCMIRPTAQQNQELERILSSFLAYHLDLERLKSRSLLIE
ncbi:MAG: DNA repair protein RecO [Bacillota bacterium]